MLTVAQPQLGPPQLFAILSRLVYALTLPIMSDCNGVLKQASELEATLREQHTAKVRIWT